MGDRAWVTLTLLTSQVEAAREFFVDEPETESEDNEFSILQFSEVNYGTLDNLDAFTAAGIAYDSEWGHGGEYGPGMESLRFTQEGKAVSLSVSDSDINPSIYKLKQLLAEEDALENIREFIAAHCRNTEPLPWANQEEYGKLYKITHLISGD